MNVKLKMPHDTNITIGWQCGSLNDLIYLRFTKKIRGWVMPWLRRYGMWIRSLCLNQCALKKWKKIRIFSARREQYKTKHKRDIPKCEPLIVVHAYWFYNHKSWENRIINPIIYTKLLPTMTILIHSRDRSKLCNY